jgi:O-antigen ligase
MGAEERDQHIKLNSLEVLLVIAMLFSPFTALRIGPIGITEIAVLIFSVIVLLRNKHVIHIGRRNDRFIFTKFWVAFMMLSITGLFYNYVIRGHISGTPGSMMFDSFSYIVVGLTCFALEIELNKKDSMKIWIIIKSIYISTSVVMLTIFIISKYTNSILGFTLNHYGFFRPLASNIHHISMGLSALPFIGLQLLFDEKFKVYKLFWLLLIVSNLLAASATGSVKVVMGFSIGFVVFLFYLVITHIKSWKLKIASITLLSAISIILIASKYSTILHSLFDFFNEEDLSGARNALYSSSLSKIMDSPIVGYGPGPHAELRFGSYHDAHQTFLTLGLQGGLFSILLYTGLIYRAIKTYAKDPYIIGSFIGIFLYAVGGDILRRLPMWILLMLFYYYRINKYPYASE